tara:strand:- start:1122 stop:1727 length:606 start_codon:yes stop_codon:yes gene_type:complete
MPKLPINYYNTIIYKLVCNDLSITDTYVGHTTEFTTRKSNHKTSCNNENQKSYNQKKYITIRENGGWDNWSMVEIERFPCENKREAEKREREIYEELDAKLNTYRPFRSDPERKQDAVDNSAKWNNEHKEHRQAYLKDYRAIHKDEIKDKRAILYQEQRGEILEKARVRTECPLCGLDISKGALHCHKTNACPNRLVQPVP